MSHQHPLLVTERNTVFNRGMTIILQVHVGEREGTGIPHSCYNFPAIIFQKIIHLCSRHHNKSRVPYPHFHSYTAQAASENERKVQLVIEINGESTWNNSDTCTYQQMCMHICIYICIYITWQNRGVFSVEILGHSIRVMGAVKEKKRRETKSKALTVCWLVERSEEAVRQSGGFSLEIHIRELCFSLRILSFNLTSLFAVHVHWTWVSSILFLGSVSAVWLCLSRRKALEGPSSWCKHHSGHPVSHIVPHVLCL